MSLFDKFRKNKDEETDDFFIEEGVTAGILPLSTLVRWYLYDMGVVDKEKIAQELELPPISSEGIEMEEMDSVQRMSRVAPFIAFAQQLAGRFAGDGHSPRPGGSGMGVSPQAMGYRVHP